MLAKRMRKLGQRLTPGQAVRRGANSTVFVLAMLGILVLVNVISARHHKRWDLSKGQSFSLAAETVQVLKGLKQDVDVVAFPDPSSDFKNSLTDLLREYQYQAGGHLHYQFVDAEAQPGLVQQYKVTAFNSVILIAGSKQEHIDAFDFSGPPDASGQPQFSGENALTNALIRVTQQKQTRVYFLTGHQERGLGDLSQVNKQLTDAGYGVETLNLIEKPDVPVDADALVIAGPRVDLNSNELETIRKWALGGGRVLLMADPAKTALPNLAALADALGVKFDSDLVVDPSGHYRLDLAALVPDYEYHTITGKTQSSQMRMLLPAARSLTLPKSDAWEVSPLLETTDKAWGQTDLNAQEAKFDAARGDIKGPLQLAAALEKKGAAGSKPVRVVVVGNAGFATDDAVRLTPANVDFVLNSVAWLTETGGGVHIQSKSVYQSRIFLTGGQTKVVIYGAVLGLPLAALLAGGLVWLRRRHL